MYNCIISTLQNVRTFPGADKIKLANILGYQVVVGLDNREGEIGALFVDDGQLSEEYAKANNLIGYTDAEGKRQGGFFTASRRVKAQRFRGEKSEAYTASLDSLAFTGYDISSFKVGDQFCELKGIPICNKYFSPATKRTATQAKEHSSKNINALLRTMFPEHKDTNQVRFALDKDLVGLVTITGKLHGTCCFSDSILVTEDGEKTIKEIVDSRYVGKVLSLATLTGEKEYKQILNYFEYENNDTWFEIELEDGTKNILTGDHLIWLPELNCYRELQNLKRGMNILFNKEIT